MFSDEDITAFTPKPFWFVSTALLADICHAAIAAIAQLFTKHSDLRRFFDAPDATTPQRTICFEVLTNLKVIEMAEETASGRYEELPFSDEELGVLGQSQNLVMSDSPHWSLEINEVAEWLPIRINSTLPELLRERSFERNDAAKNEVVRSAAKSFSSVEQIQTLIRGVFDQQLQRLRERWSTEIAKTEIVMTPNSNKSKQRRKRDAQLIKRDALIAEIAGITKTPAEFLQMMDERKVQPQPTWNWPGSWTQAYKNRDLRKLIHQDKSRAVSRALARRRR